eukprot:4778878-Pyramimonas_sp.AAC.1
MVTTAKEFQHALRLCKVGKIGQVSDVAFAAMAGAVWRVRRDGSSRGSRVILAGRRRYCEGPSPSSLSSIGSRSNYCALRGLFYVRSRKQRQALALENSSSGSGCLIDPD